MRAPPVGQTTQCHYNGWEHWGLARGLRPLRTPKGGLRGGGSHLQGSEHQQNHPPFAALPLAYPGPLSKLVDRGGIEPPTS